ncbi:hypothetical protein [Phaeobacter sp. 11ANDIMAR09]|uniref:hypothetical protein n=1 Tax=Phaeobacter sp. 11ANDIMAR09 TaxID=1225647 RepID=UPI0006C830F3|nr:hypothetical protein [Phaeobacter sp. 11ANDIMAR09]KPD13549.1 hypothetical protein AN476_04995 [Phaeobacter sp. 11ANDIMAR09]OIQ35082.1 MAG: hypothetical protein BM559_03765 [Roseobacter sp. MedPE-SWchi]
MFRTALGLSVLGFTASLMAASPALAQGRNCAPRDVVVERLASKYGESRQAIGIGQQGMVMETFASAESGSWTITVTMPTGMTCLMASGQSFEALAEAVPTQDNGA